jgi:hypothetical protein
MKKPTSEREAGHNRNRLRITLTCTNETDGILQELADNMNATRSAIVEALLHDAWHYLQKQKNPDYQTDSQSHRLAVARFPTLLKD